VRSRKQQQPTFITPTMAAGLLLLAGAYFMGQRVSSLGTRLGKVEQEAEYSSRDRKNRQASRDWWVGKVLPAVGVIVVPLVVVGITQGWFR